MQKLLATSRCSHVKIIRYKPFIYLRQSSNKQRIFHGKHPKYSNKYVIQFLNLLVLFSNLSALRTTLNIVLYSKFVCYMRQYAQNPNSLFIAILGSFSLLSKTLCLFKRFQN